MSTRKKEIKELENVGVAAEEPKQTKTQETLIYIGDSLPGGTLQKYSLFKNGVIPDSLQTHIKKCPAIRELIISVSSLSESRIQLLVAGSRENTLNGLIQKYIRGDK
ncbi:hypothetical protein HMPREF1013_00837 [Bacillus sp. 2_A_57_CT2]|nr:hypothetical protein HMPREF1013_00837 [Bacillus sp. 2_A_57_CT2]